MNISAVDNRGSRRSHSGAASDAEGRPLCLRSTVKRAAISVLFLLLTAGAVTGLVTHQVLAVKGQLEGALALIPEMRGHLEEGEQPAAQDTLNRIQEQVSAARSTVTGPLWKLASVVPFAGPNFGAVREVTVSVDDVSTQALAPLIGQYESLDWRALSPTGGRIDVDQLQGSAPTLLKSATTVRQSYERIASVDLSNLVPQVAEPIRSATEQLRNASSALETASSAAQLLPALLGVDGPRTYLVLVQNSAEARATGGISGALATLEVEDGLISLGAQSSAGDVGAFKPALGVDLEQTAIYTERLGTQMQNVNLTPEFPTAAQTAKRMWEERNTGQTIDGVLAVDPVVLRHLLEATGPVKLADPEILSLVRETSLPSALTNDNVLPTLLSDVYREIENPKAQDAYFSAVAASVFSAFTEGQGDGGELVKALAASAEENRLYLWSSHSEEQDIITSTPLHGSVTGKDAGGANFGVYFNDGTGAKMDYYVNRTVQIIQACSKDEYGQFVVRVTATNNAPADAASSLPAYVTGGGVFGVEPGRIRTNYVVYGPSQAFVETATVNGQPVPVSSGKHGQRPVGTVPLELGPGETSTIDMVFSSVVQNSAPRLRVTPSIQSVEDVVLPFERESCG